MSELIVFDLLKPIWWVVVVLCILGVWKVIDLLNKLLKSEKK